MRDVHVVRARAAARGGLLGTAGVAVVGAGGVRIGWSESTAAYIVSRLLLCCEQRLLSGVAPAPLECWQRPLRADAGAVCGCVDREKHFALQLLEHRWEARPLLGAARAALRGEL